MNWSRGLLRAWLIVTVIWLAPALFLTVHYWPDRCCDPYTHEVTDPHLLSRLEDRDVKAPPAPPLPEGLELNKSVEASTPEMRDYLSSLSDEALLEKYLSMLKPWERNGEKGQQAKDALGGVHRRHVARTLLSITFLPPIGLFALGWAALWIGRGFKAHA